MQLAGFHPAKISDSFSLGRGLRVSSLTSSRVMLTLLTQDPLFWEPLMWRKALKGGQEASGPIPALKSPVTPDRKGVGLISQPRLALCDPVDCGSSVPGILQARTLEQVAIPFSRGTCQPRGRTQASCLGRWILYHLSHKGNPTLDGVLCFSLWSKWEDRADIFLRPFISSVKTMKSFKISVLLLADSGSWDLVHLMPGFFLPSFLSFI